jgi:hypothetical protein
MTIPEKYKDLNINELIKILDEDNPAMHIAMRALAMRISKEMSILHDRIDTLHIRIDRIRNV